LRDALAELDGDVAGRGVALRATALGATALAATALAGETFARERELLDLAIRTKVEQSDVVPAPRGDAARELEAEIEICGGGISRP